jgi:molecular chaperone Hsp33
MSDAPIIITDRAGSRDNEVRPFQIEGMNVHGRAVRLGTVVEQILSAHNYPDSINVQMGNILCLTAMLGSMLKYDGIVTIQFKGSGALKMLVADLEQNEGKSGKLRAYAQIDKTILAQYGKKPSFIALMKKGFMALTIDQGEDMDRYQGIVELEGTSLKDSAVAYFKQSEQTPTEIRLTTSRDPVTGHWRSGGIMVQHLARGETNQERNLDEDKREAWNRASILMNSVKDEELTDPTIDLDQLLMRLYHEDGVRVFEPSHLEHGCRCSRERIYTVLRSLSEDDIEHAFEEDKVIKVNCEFCNKNYAFSEEEIREALRKT